MIAPGFLHTPEMAHWLGGIEAPRTLLAFESFNALRREPTKKNPALSLANDLTEPLGPTGKPFSERSIGMALATRNLMDQLGSAGQTTGGPPPFGPPDRSRFLSALDNVIARLMRADIEASHSDAATFCEQRPVNERP